MGFFGKKFADLGYQEDTKHRYNKKDVIYDEVVFDSRIKHKDIFSMKNLYVLMREWFVEEGWVKTRTDADFPEEKYLHRFTQQSGQELWIWWRLEKKISPYYTWAFDVDVHVVGMKDTEIMQDGKKFKVNHGEPELKLYGKVIIDPQGEWRKHKLLGALHELFYKRVMKKQLEMQRKMFLRELFRFKEAVKVYFKLYGWLPEREDQRFWYNKDFSG